VEDKYSIIKRLFTSNYSIDINHLNKYNIRSNDVLNCVNSLIKEANYDEALQILRKAELIWSRNYQVVCKLMLTYVNLGDFMAAHDEMQKLEKMSQEHEREVYNVIRALKTYYNVTHKYKIPNVYQYGYDFKDSYKKWDLLNAQMFSVEEKLLHKVLVEINRIVIERKISEINYYDDFDSILEKLYYEPSSFKTRDDLAIYLHDNNLSQYQDFFMWLFYTKDKNIAEYLDTVTRGMKINVNELFHELTESVNKNDFNGARQAYNLMNMLPDETYPENDKKLNEYIFDRYDYKEHKALYKDAKKNEALEEKVIEKIKLNEEVTIKEMNANTADKIEYLLDLNNVPFEYEIIDGIHVFTLNKASLNEVIVEQIDNTITWSIDNIDYLIDKVVYKCTPIQRAVKKLPKNQKVKATLMIAREAFNAGKFDLAINILKYANELSMQLPTTKDENELKNIIQDRVKALHK